MINAKNNYRDNRWCKIVINQQTLSYDRIKTARMYKKLNYLSYLYKLYTHLQVVAIGIRSLVPHEFDLKYIVVY